MIKSAVPSVTVRAACLVFGGHTLFDDLEFTLPAGYWTCLLGPSGVGKTSLLRLIAGLESGHPEGAATCGDGQPLAGRAAYMAQQDLLLPWLSVLDNVRLGHVLRGENHRPEVRSRACHLLEQVGLAHRADDLPATLSGGMRQRVALARTLMEDRPVVLMDEPFSALDAFTRVQLQELFASLLQHRTVLLVTHDPLEALRLGHRIHVMAGRPAQVDAPLEPRNPPLRDIHDPGLLNLQADLLDRLSDAANSNGEAH